MVERAPRATGPRPARPSDADAPKDPARLRVIEAAVGSIGPKMRELRQQRGLSLLQMAALSEVSAASIHKVERGDMVPTITTLMKLAAAFGQPVAYFVDDQPRDSDGAVLTRADARPPLPSAAQGEQRARVTALSPRFRLCGETVQLDAGASGHEESTARPGEQLLVVLAGSLDVLVGEQSLTVRKGDALHYLTDRPLHWTNTSRRPVTVLRVSLPPA